MDICYLLDPLIATGGTACAALQMLADWGLPSEYQARSWVYFPPESHPHVVQNVKLLAIVASEIGLKKITSEFPELEVCSLVDIIAQCVPIIPP